MGFGGEYSVIRFEAGRGLIEDGRGSLRQSRVVMVVGRIDSKLDESRRQQVQAFFQRLGTDPYFCTDR